MPDKESKKEAKPDNLLFETHSWEMQEVVGKMPHWIVRWGVTVIGVILLALLPAAYFIKYPDIVTVNVMLAPSSPPLKIKSPSTGIVRLNVKEGDTVVNGSALAFLNDTVFISAQADGHVAFLRPIKDHDLVEKGEPLFVIMPASPAPPKVVAKVMLKDRSRIKQSQEIYIDVEGFPAREFGFLKGTIAHISPFDINGLYVVHNDIANRLITTTNFAIPFNSAMSAKGEIVVTDKTVLQRLLQQLTEML